MGTFEALYDHLLAEFPDERERGTAFEEGVPDDIERTVSENSRTLNFEDFGFEEE